MEILEEKINDVHILNLNGRLDATCVSDLKDVVLAMIDADKLKILIDMAKVDFVDSSGLGTLVTCLRSVTKAGGVFKIATLRKDPKKLFEITRLDRVFDMHEDRGAALNSF
ncbi:MAG: STAS domain-containing protein [Desulfobacterales bacterium]|jgi:anti-sigma B factor antagonist